MSTERAGHRAAKAGNDALSVQLPLYAKLVLLLVGLIAFGYFAVISRPISVPLVFSLVIAILLNPVVEYLRRWGMGRVPAIVCALLGAMLVLVALGYFIGTQAMQLQDQLPAFKQKFTGLVTGLQNWVSTRLHMDPERMDALITKARSEGLNKSGALLGGTLTLVGGLFGFLFLLPVYVFLFLFYKRFLLEFVARLFPRREQDTVADVLVETRTLIQSYLVGLLVEAAIVAAMNTLCLYLIGVPYALVLGIIGALLNMVPYIGGLIAIAMPMLLAVATLEPISALWVLVGYSVVQFIDNHFIVPRIVASRVEVNALVAIVVVLVGGAIWGVAGMFLSLPLTAIVKVVCDRVPALMPFGFVLGDESTTQSRAVLKLPSRKGRRAR